jgi:hypothetical protein
MRVSSRNFARKHGVMYVGESTILKENKSFIQRTIFKWILELKGNNQWWCLVNTVVMKCKKKVKQSPLQAWSGPEGSRKLRFPDFLTTAHYGGKVVSPTHRPHLPPGNTPGTHFY